MADAHALIPVDPVRHLAILREGAEGARPQAARLACGRAADDHAPKPQLLPLTGGYRRIPVLQIGADVYCDTQLIVRVLERLAPSPTLYPGGSEGTCEAWQLWADKLVFTAAVSVIFGEIGQFVPKEFMDDRTKMMPGRDFNEIPKLAPHAREQLRAYIATIAAQLGDGRAHLLGAEFSLADAACFHSMWFLRMAPQAKSMIADGRRASPPGSSASTAWGTVRRQWTMTPAEALEMRASSNTRDRRRRRSARAQQTRRRRARDGHAGRLRLRSGRRRAGRLVGARGRRAASGTPISASWWCTSRASASVSPVPTERRGSRMRHARALPALLPCAASCSRRAATPATESTPVADGQRRRDPVQLQRPARRGRDHLDRRAPRAALRPPVAATDDFQFDGIPCRRRRGVAGARAPRTIISSRPERTSCRLRGSSRITFQAVTHTTSTRRSARCSASSPTRSTPARWRPPSPASADRCTISGAHGEGRRDRHHRAAAAGRARSDLLQRERRARPQPQRDQRGRRRPLRPGAARRGTC